MGGGGGCSKSRGPCHVLKGSYSGGGWAYRKVEGVYFAKWRRCILQSGGGLSGGGVFYILQGKCYNHMNCRACI